MAEKKKSGFTGRDYLMMGISVLLAFSVWLIHNLSLRYSSLIKCPVAVISELDGYARESENASFLAARCDMTGYDIIRHMRIKEQHPLKIHVKPTNLHKGRGDVHYMCQEDFTTYFHDIFGNDAKLEYFMTDTLFFRFKQTDYKKVPVKANASLDFKPQYVALSELKIVPDSILVYGDVDKISTVETVATEFIRLTGLDGEVYGEVKIKPVKGLRFSRDKVEYSLAVARYVSVSVTLPVTVVNVPAGLAVQAVPDVATLTCKCFFPGNDSLEGMRVTVDYEEYTSSLNGKCKARVENAPAWVISSSLDPLVFECVVR